MAFDKCEYQRLTCRLTKMIHVVYPCILLLYLFMHQKENVSVLETKNLFVTQRKLSSQQNRFSNQEWVITIKRWLRIPIFEKEHACCACKDKVKDICGLMLVLVQQAGIAFSAIMQSQMKFSCIVQIDSVIPIYRWENTWLSINGLLCLQSRMVDYHEALVMDPAW